MGHGGSKRSGPYRVVQWATGNIGLRSLQAVIEHPELDLVGLFVYSEGKEGKDAGELCGLAPTGVKATRNADEIVSLRPDCVLYMGDRADIDVICRLLESGANVRLIGQDSRRGTFSQRHAALIDYDNGAQYVPLAAIAA